MPDLVQLRHALHSQPELAGREERTAATIAAYLRDCNPDELIENIGGHGLAAVYIGPGDGPRVLVRCELDALPVPETIALDYGSQVEGAAHKCGHDGHMTIVAGLARRLQRARPRAGSVVLLYQPAEETGEGARRVVDDARFQQIKPDFALALHNMPGYPARRVIVGCGVFASASTGLRVRLHGQTAHAAEPESGVSPALAVADLIHGLSSLPQFHTALHQPAQVTIVHARLGEEAYGTSPGYAEVAATFRSHAQDVMDALLERAATLAERTAAVYGLEFETEQVQPFPVTANDPGVVNAISRAAKECGHEVHKIGIPLPWSEDFGHFTSLCRGALFGLGAGEDQPALHNPEYDFPDELIESGVSVMSSAVDRLLEDGDA